MCIVYNVNNYRVKKLILADPWGFETLEDRLSEVNVLIKCILGLFSCCGCNPLFAMRVAGPYGCFLYYEIN